jgi:phage baseplate assembly protein W
VNTYRAWAFEYPDSAVPGKRGGLRLSPRGRIAMIEGNAAVRQAIQMLLSTAPGERVMRPGYGCDLQRLIFAPNDETTAGLAIHYVRQAIERWEPRVEILSLDAGRNLEWPELLDIQLEYRVRETQQVEQLEVALNLAGEES